MKGRQPRLGHREVGHARRVSFHDAVKTEHDLGVEASGEKLELRFDDRVENQMAWDIGLAAKRNRRSQEHQYQTTQSEKQMSPAEIPRRL